MVLLGSVLEFNKAAVSTVQKLMRIKSFVPRLTPIYLDWGCKERVPDAVNRLQGSGIFLNLSIALYVSAETIILKDFLVTVQLWVSTK